MSKTEYCTLDSWPLDTAQLTYFRWQETAEEGLPIFWATFERDCGEKFDTEFPEILALEMLTLDKAIAQGEIEFDRIQNGVMTEIIPPMFSKGLFARGVIQYPGEYFIYDLDAQRHFVIKLGEEILQIAAADMKILPFEEGGSDARDYLF